MSGDNGAELVFQLLHFLSHFLLKVRLVFLHQFYSVMSIFEMFRYFLQLELEVGSVWVEI